MRALCSESIPQQLALSLKRLTRILGVFHQRYLLRQQTGYIQDMGIAVFDLT